VAVEILYVRSDRVCEPAKCEPEVGVVGLVVGVPPPDDPPFRIRCRSNTCRNSVFLSLNFFRMLLGSLSVAPKQRYYDSRNGARAKVQGVCEMRCSLSLSVRSFSFAWPCVRSHLSVVCKRLTLCQNPYSGRCVSNGLAITGSHPSYPLPSTPSTTRGWASGLGSINFHPLLRASSL
jgi:hypothetical protein